MRRKATAYVALIAILFGGCASPPSCHEGELIAAHPSEVGASGRKTQYEGDYALYRGTDLAEASSPQAGDASQQNNEDGLRGLFHVSSQEWLGFTHEKGQLFALVGGERIPLPPGRYCWHAAPESDLSASQKATRDATKARETTATIVSDACMAVVGTVVIVGLVALVLVCLSHSSSTGPYY